METYVIRCTEAQEETLYWSNSDGWVNIANATRFSKSESCTFDLPMGGEWVKEGLTPEPTYDYNVRFVGDWFVLTTTVSCAEDSEDTAIKGATELLHMQYGWDMDSCATVDITAERTDDINLDKEG